MIAHSCTSNFEGSSKKRPLETIRLETSHSCFCQAGRSGSSLFFLGLSEKFVRDSLYVTRIRIQEGGGLFELYLQSVDDLL